MTDYCYVSIKPNRYRSLPIFMSDRPSVSIFWHDFHNGEWLESSDSPSDTRRIGWLSIHSKSLMETHGTKIGYDFEFK